MPYDSQKDLAPITLAVGCRPQFLVATPTRGGEGTSQSSSRWRRRSKLSYASCPVGSASHLTMEMLKSAAHRRHRHVPYKGAQPAVAISSADRSTRRSSFRQRDAVRAAGPAKVIASTGKKRFAATPDVPTMIERAIRTSSRVSWIGFLRRLPRPKPSSTAYNKEMCGAFSSAGVRRRARRTCMFEVVGS
jgi:tripartite-type tricarboxylate transporter receptor subunit TctC